jgi:YfiH family protein
VSSELNRAGPLVHSLLRAAGIDHGFGVRDGAPPAGLVVPRQVHGVAVAEVVAGRAEPGEADAILSMDPEIPVGIVTADCVPVLAACRSGAAVVAIHAGWRGLAAGVVEAGVAALTSRVAPGEELIAVIGPHIGQCCYEVDEPVLGPLRDRFGGELDRSLEPSRSPGRFMLELARLVDLALERSGLPASNRGLLRDVCTFCSPSRFPSYRRDGDLAGRIVHHIRPRRSS